MDKGRYVSISGLLRELGQRLAAQRLSLDLTQAEVAKQAGISKRTLERLESGEASTRLEAFLRVCWVLGLRDRIDRMLPEPKPSPVAQLKLKGRTRKRASRQPEADYDEEDPMEIWKRIHWHWEP